MKVKLGEIATIKGGKRMPKGTNLQIKKNEHPYLRITDFDNGRFNMNSLKYVPQDVFQKISSYTISKNDIFLSIVGTIGLVALVNKELDGASLTENAVKIVPKSKVDNQYLAYYLQSFRGKSQIDALSVGSTQKKLPIKNIKKLEIELPKYSEQCSISHKLAILDKKIELNNEINANLVELSNTIFKQILVSNDLHEFTINDIGTVAGGGTPSKKIISYWNGNIPWLSPKDLSNKPRIFTSSGENYITQQGLDNSSTKLLPRNTVLFSSRAPIGYLSIAKNRIATNQGFKSVIPNKQYPFWFIYELLKVETPRIINEANGSTFKEVSGSRLKQHIVYVPKSSDVLRYNSIFISLFQKMMQSESEIDTLNSLKRALLNKLF